MSDLYPFPAAPCSSSLGTIFVNPGVRPDPTHWMDGRFALRCFQITCWTDLRDLTDIIHMRWSCWLNEWIVSGAKKKKKEKISEGPSDSLEDLWKGKVQVRLLRFRLYISALRHLSVHRRWCRRTRCPKAWRGAWTGELICLLFQRLDALPLKACTIPLELGRLGKARKPLSQNSSKRSAIFGLFPLCFLGLGCCCPVPRSMRQEETRQSTNCTCEGGLNWRSRMLRIGLFWGRYRILFLLSDRATWNRGLYTWTRNIEYTRVQENLAQRALLSWSIPGFCDSCMLLPALQVMLHAQESWPPMFRNPAFLRAALSSYIIWLHSVGFIILVVLLPLKRTSRTKFPFCTVCSATFPRGHRAVMSIRGVCFHPCRLFWLGGLLARYVRIYIYMWNEWRDEWIRASKD